MFMTIEESETDEERIITRVPNSAFFLKGVRVRIPHDGRATNTFFDVGRPQSNHTE
jgi:hypothetical protein